MIVRLFFRYAFLRWVLCGMVGVFSVGCSTVATTIDADLSSIPSLRGGVINASMPTFDPSLVAFEKETRGNHALYVFNFRDNSTIQITAGSVVKPTEEDVVGSIFGINQAETESLSGYEGRLAWRPLRDSFDRLWFAFISSQSQGYALVLGYLDRENQLSRKYDHPALRRTG